MYRNRKCWISLIFICLFLLSACSDPTADTAINKLTEVGIYTFTAVSYTEQEGPRVLKPGGRGSIPGESLYYAVMESDSGDYRFYEPMESMNAAMCAVNGNFGIVSPLSLEIQIFIDKESGINYFFDTGTDCEQALEQIQNGSYVRLETFE